LMRKALFLSVGREPGQDKKVVTLRVFHCWPPRV